MMDIGIVSPPVHDVITKSPPASVNADMFIVFKLAVLVVMRIPDGRSVNAGKEMFVRPAMVDGFKTPPRYLSAGSDRVVSADMVLIWMGPPIDVNDGKSIVVNKFIVFGLNVLPTRVNEGNDNVVRAERLGLKLPRTVPSALKFIPVLFTAAMVRGLNVPPTIVSIGN